MSEQLRFMLIVSPLLQTSPAFARAAALAKAAGAALHIVAFDYLEGLAAVSMLEEPVLTQLRQRYLEQHRLWLEAQACSLRETGVAITTEVLWVERPLQQIIIHLKLQRITALIKAVEHDSLISRLMFTPLDIHLLRECPVPLHFVSHMTNALPRKIVAAVNPFHRDDRYKAFNDRLVQEAGRLASACNAELDVIYAHEFSSSSAEPYGCDYASMLLSPGKIKHLFDAQAEAFQALADRNGIAPEHQRMIMGSPAKVLSSYAYAYDIDVIVMGRLNHGGMKRLESSTVEDLLYKMPCSVWVVSPEAMIGKTKPA